MKRSYRDMLRGAITLSMIGALLCGATACATEGESAGIPYSTPPGITLVNVSKVFDSTQDQFLWRRLGDAEGKPLYTFDADTTPNQSTCLAECAQQFPPVVALRDARSYSDWSIVTRADGVKQWAYQGKPLHRYSGEDPQGQPYSGSTASLTAEDPDWYDPSSKFYSPQSGWRRVAFSPEKTMQAPPGLELQSLAVANGFGFVDAASGMTVYALAASAKPSSQWVMVQAPALAKPIGEFSIAKAEDRTPQWLYKGKRLYTFKGDYAAGDVNGIFAGKEAQAALAYRNFLPESLVIALLQGRGPMMVTQEGKSVYTQARYNLQYGGRQTRIGYTIPYNEAKAVGTRGCVQQCTGTWKPVLTPKNAQASGYWEVATRADGSKQWAYKGSPLYTYVQDKESGDILGNNRHVIVYGDPEGKISLDVTVGDLGYEDGGSASRHSGSGFYWHLASLVY